MTQPPTKVEAGKPEKKNGIMITTEKYGCRAVAGILRGHGVRRVVLCPGSRDLPLVMAFAREEGMKCCTAIDERSAAFIALGQAIGSGEAVAVVCTSGTALLNMAPAVAEAYYRNVPLIVVSADRPGRWIDQADSQTLRQPAALTSVVKRSYNIVAEGEKDDERWYIDRIVNDAAIAATTGKRGPVHINVEIDEPLNKEAEVSGEYRIIRRAETRMSLSDDDRKRLASEMLGCSKVLVLAGNMAPCDVLNRALMRLGENGNVAILTEPLANVSAGIRNIEATLSILGGEGREEMRPELLITLGGAIVSGLTKKWLRKGVKAHWHIGEGDETMDTFKCLTERIDMKPADFFRETASVMRRGTVYGGENSDYGEKWREASKRAYNAVERGLEAAEWSDVKALNEIVKMLPGDANVQLSNGMTVRYYEWVSEQKAHRTDCNRGVSGIDGSTSTAIGAASVSKGMTVFMTGDMSAQYDIGALASLRLVEPAGRFKMVVFANGGGNIFKYIKNTRDTAETPEFLYNSVDTDWKGVGEAYGMAVYEATDMTSLKEQGEEWMRESERSALLIVGSDAEVNAQVMINLVKSNK